MHAHETGRPPAGAGPLEDTDPRELGGYTLLGRIGAGGMGTVFLGADPGSGERVAVKTLHPRLAGDESFRARFRDEAVLAGRVASFCTARVLAHGAEDDRPYIVSEYVGGMSLQHRINTAGPLPGADLHGVAVSVASALAAIHTAGLVHHDLKPANVMLTLSGCRVIDFGIARQQGSPGTLTSSGSVLGTPGWMPPEVTAGGAGSPAADVFGWGCLIAYAGTGRLPFGDGAATAVAMRVLTEEPDLDGLPDGLLPIVRSALAKSPGDRPSASDLLLALVEQTGPGDLKAAGTAPAAVPEPTGEAPPVSGEVPAVVTETGEGTQALGVINRIGSGSTLRTRVLAGAGAAAATVLAGGLFLGLSGGGQGGTIADPPARPAQSPVAVHDPVKPAKAAKAKPAKKSGHGKPSKDKEKKGRKGKKDR
ncbi:serine/threonine protein kinase [Actinomadura hibisca]|uniref:serine/threonine protein kinase n=1 Tax=Actinomadura hibisca TaxID=68565 RepID=UPI00082CBFBC|nr:serine/threonine-protein kinase [Actinomadura hibisca]